MKNNGLPFNWFDLVVAVFLIAGILRGRKRGMSQEVVTLLQWFAILLCCAFFYEPVGRWLAGSTPISLLTSFVIAYVVVAALVSILFVVFKRVVGGKLIGSDAFGKGEYYLGMPAGMLRFACILLCVLALLNARFYSKQEIENYQKFQQDVYGSEFFPGLQAVQANVFENSLIGPHIKKNLAFLLIRPTPPGGGKDLKQKEWEMR